MSCHCQRHRSVDAARHARSTAATRSRRQFATLKSALLSGSLVRDLRAGRDVRGAHDVSFDGAGRPHLGVIGRNGSGKSTMLKLRRRHHASRRRGTVTVNGRISALIELGAGFHPEISGPRERLHQRHHARPDRSARSTRRFDEIVEFAELEDFIDAPVKTYSSGMYMRLGFAVAIHVDPDVLLVDEVLAVGDEGFTHKCLDKFARVQAPRQDDPARHALARPGRAVLRRGAVARRRPDRRPRAIRKRVVGAYITDVERQRGAAARGRRREGAGRRPARSSPDEPASAVLPDHPVETADGAGRHVPRDRGPLGIARGRDHRRHAARRRRRARPRLPLAASASTIRLRMRAPLRRSTTSSSASGSSTPKACAATAPTPTSRSSTPSGSRRRRGRRSPSSASTSSRAPTSSTSRSTSATATRTTTTACSTRSA